MKDNNERFLEELLDSALARYSAAEPGPGLESRVLAKVRQARSPLPRFAFAAAAATLILTLGLVWHQRIWNKPPRTAGPPAVVAQGKTSELRKPEQARRKIVARFRPNGEEVTAKNPKLPAFPAPRPLDEQERLALRYLRNRSPEELRAALTQPPLQKLQIEPVQIKPIEIPGIGESRN